MSVKFPFFGGGFGGGGGGTDFYFYGRADFSESTGVKKASPWKSCEQKSEKGLPGPRGPGVNMLKKKSKTSRKKASFSTLFRALFDPGAARGPGNPFSDFFSYQKNPRVRKIRVRNSGAGKWLPQFYGHLEQNALFLQENLCP